jgi:hypothetical protein
VKLLKLKSDISKISGGFGPFFLFGFFVFTLFMVMYAVAVGA